MITMVNTSGAFLTKSVILLSLLIISMGTSLVLGKAMGKSIMALTRSNIQEKVEKSKGGSNNSSDLMIGMGERSSFGFNSENFGTDRLKIWADPQVEQFSSVTDEPSVRVDILEDSSGEENGSGQVDGSQETSQEIQNTTEEEKKQNDGSIFSLSGKSTFRIQVGTFRDEINAESVWKRLTQAGYDAHVSALNDANGTRYKVYVGAYKNREEADKVAEQLRSLNFDAWVYEDK